MKSRWLGWMQASPYLVKSSTMLEVFHLESGHEIISSHDFSYAKRIKKWKKNCAEIRKLSKKIKLSGSKNQAKKELFFSL